MAFSRGASTIKPLLDFYSRGGKTLNEFFLAFYLLLSYLSSSFRFLIHHISYFSISQIIVNNVNFSLSLSLSLFCLDARFDLKYMEINVQAGFNASTRCPFILSATVLGPLCLYTAYLSSQKKKELFPWQSVCASIEIYNTVGFFIHFFMTKGLDQLHMHTLPVLFVLCINTLWFYINSYLLEESFLKLIK